MTRTLAAVVALALPLTAAAATARTLRTTTPVEGLAADGATVVVSTAWAAGSCERTVSWNPLRPTLRPLGPRRRCPRTSTGRRITYQAVAGTRAAWVTDVGGNQREARLFTASLRRPRAAKQVAVARRDADSGAGDYVGNVHGDGSLLVYGTWSVCEAGGAPFKACPAGVQPGRIFDARVWRIVGASRKLVARAPGELSPLAASAGRILVRRADGSLATLSPAGATLAVMNPAPAQVLDASMGGRDVAALVRTPPVPPPPRAVPPTLAVNVYDAATGALKRSWPIPTPVGTPLVLRLEDVERGLAVYIDGAIVRLLRLADGRTTSFATPPRKDLLPGEPTYVHAALEPAGLFYSYRLTTRSGGRVRFIPFREIRFA